MKPILKLRIVVDIAMTAALLLLMAYGLVGEAAHEWIGMGMLVLFVLHHILNRKWCAALMRGRYTPFRVVQTALAGLIFLSMMGSMVSGIILSRHVFNFLPIHGGYALAGRIHMICAYWGLVFMSLHLGIHWKMMLSIAGKHWKPSSVRTWILRIAGILIAAYGVFAFPHREIGSYLFLKSHFVFFDYSEPVVFFLLDYLAVMGLFVWIGYYVSKLLKIKSILKKR